MSLTFEDKHIQTKAGKTRYATLCPQCSHTRKKKNDPCLTVNDEPGNRWFKCWNCNYTGNLDTEGKFDQVREKSLMPERMPVTYTKVVREFLTKRGISPRTALTAGVYEASESRSNLLGFPYYMTHTLVNVKYLNLGWKKGNKGPKWWQMKKDLGTRRIPWGLNLLKFDIDEPKKPRIVIWTEGEIDALTWRECSYNNAISVPQGAPSEKAKDFKKEFEYMHDPYVKSITADVHLHYLSVDADNPGKLLMKHLATILGKSKCRIIKYPTGYKDINEVYMGNEEKKLAPLGQEGVDECFQSASGFPLAGVIKASDVQDDMKMIRKGGFKPGWGIGIPEVDRLFTIKRKHISGIVGIPSVGKSVFARWYLIELIRNNVDDDIKVALFTPESRPIAREYARIAEVLTGTSIREDAVNSMSDIQYQKAMRFVEKHFFIISPDKLNFESFGGKVEGSTINTIDSILSYVAYLKKVENVQILLIDPFNKIDANIPRNMTETLFIAQQLDKLIQFCDYYDVHCMMVVHPKKIENQGLNYKPPVLYDAKGSSAFYERLDVGIVLSRQKFRKKRAEEITIPNPAEDDWWEPLYNAPTIVRAEKVRFEEIGKEGITKLKMDPKRGGRFYVEGKENEQPKQKKIEQDKINDIFGGMEDRDESSLPF